MENDDENVSHAPETSLPYGNGGGNSQSHYVDHDEGPVERDSYGDGDSAGLIPQPHTVGEVADASGDCHQSAPIVDVSCDTAGQTAGTAESDHSGTPLNPNKNEAGTPPSNVRGGAEVDRSRSPKSNHGDQPDVSFEHDSDDAGEQMLLERDGKFRVVNADDVMAEEDVRSRSSSTSSDAALRISSLSLKTSSCGSRGHTSSRRSGGQPPAPRSKSAVALPGSRRRSVDYSSTHRLTEEQKQQLERQQARKAELARREEQQRREKDDKKRQECEEAFEAWLRKKRVDAAQRRRERIHEIRGEREKNSKNKVVSHSLQIVYYSLES